MAKKTQWLYEKYNGSEEILGAVAEIPADITDALRYPLREYQTKALQRFIHYSESSSNNHALFEMATGAGKTLLMASLMLYLYKKGYRNFIFFVNSTTILEKTKANFADAANAKYLFANDLTLNSAPVTINPINNLDEASPDALNIIFTTIQTLHITLENPRENAVTFDDLENYKLVLLGDEAHHFQTQSKQRELTLASSWENTVERIFKGNADNVLLELTATAGLDKLDIADKYHDKLLYKYALAEFCNDGYSKIISILVNRSDNRYRMLLALLVNQFRREIAAEHQISLKPVILFKSPKIEESKSNQQLFLDLLDNLEAEDVKKALDEIAGNSDQSYLIDVMVSFWQKKSPMQIATTLKREFSADRILNVNDDKEKEKLQLEINSLENKNSIIRVIFAVNKLNEGWDVLNLFDIVKLFETGSKNQTTQEAQLIGRGARYYPFSEKKNDENYFKRKYENDSKHVLRFLETLHYHTKDDSAFINQLNKQLEANGLIVDKQLKEVSLDLKFDFKQSDIYSKGYIFLNERLHRGSAIKQYFKDGHLKKDMFGDTYIPHPAPEELNSQVYILTNIEEQEITEQSQENKFNVRHTKQVKDISFSIFYTALSKNTFYQFDRLSMLLDIKSMRDLYEKCGKVSITFVYDAKQSREPTAEDKLKGVIAVLDKLQKLLMAREYKGSKFERKPINKVFTNKKITVGKDIEILDGSSANYFAQEKFSGTSEEKALVEDIEGYLQAEGENVSQAWLIRNEGHFTIYNFDDGTGFRPDFVLFLQKPNDVFLTYQLFIEPKGEHLKQYDAWKEKFMDKINNDVPIIELDEKNKQKIIGLPFYNTEQPSPFMDKLKEELEL